MVLALIVLTALTAAPASVAAPKPDNQPRYYFTLFAGQSVPFRARTGHTWALYAKSTPMADGSVAVESFTISWLPADTTVHPLRLRPEPGKNFTLEETFAIMAEHNANVSRWGPYEIDAHRYQLAQQQARFLESGEPQYRSIDSFNLNQNVVNCVHAVTHASPVVRNRVQPVIRVGEPGTSRLAQMYLRGGSFEGYPETHDWVIPATGADQYPSVSRQPGEWIPRRMR